MDVAYEGTGSCIDGLLMSTTGGILEKVARHAKSCLRYDVFLSFPYPKKYPIRISPKRRYIVARKGGAVVDCARCDLEGWHNENMA
jgi:hypothetical protein